MCSRLERSWMFKRSGFSVYMVRSKAENRRVFEANNEGVAAGQAKCSTEPDGVSGDKPRRQRVRFHRPLSSSRTGDNRKSKSGATSDSGSAAARSSRAARQKGMGSASAANSGQRRHDEEGRGRL